MGQERCSTPAHACRRPARPAPGPRIRSRIRSLSRRPARPPPRPAPRRRSGPAPHLRPALSQPPAACAAEPVPCCSRRAAFFAVPDLCPTCAWPSRSPLPPAPPSQSPAAPAPPPPSPPRPPSQSPAALSAAVPAPCGPAAPRKRRRTAAGAGPRPLSACVRSLPYAGGRLTRARRRGRGVGRGSGWRPSATAVRWLGVLLGARYSVVLALSPGGRRRAGRPPPR